MNSNEVTIIPPICADESRLAALYRYDILDTPRETEFDDLTSMVSHICQAPIAVINFIDRDRQFFKSEIGLGVREMPLDVSICTRALLEQELMVIPDTTKDSRFDSNPLVTGQPYLRFYAGALLSTPEGTPLGTLCVLDYTPRQLTAPQAEALRTLARVVMTQLELRRSLRAQANISSEREAAKLALERTIVTKDQFLAELSHELRSPLNPILITASALEADTRLPEALREDVRTIRRSAQLEARLIDDLLDLTRINRGKVELRPEVVSVREQLHQAMRMLEPEAANKGLRLALDATALHDNVRADPARLQQIISNLLRNAIKFTPEGGLISITARDGLGDFVQIAVTDTGIGIDAVQLSKVFNAYEQGERSVTRRFGGLGLGLAICKALVESHGGTIDCFSKGTGKGSTFTISLPAAPARNEPAVAPVARARNVGLSTENGPGVAGRPRRILLVEDNEPTARVMARLLRHMSHEVATAGNMATAIQTATRSPFDLLISDVGLPDGSGLDLMRELKMRYGLSGIAVTGYGMEEDIRKCREAGFHLHLTKPISVDQLRTAIDQID